MNNVFDFSIVTNWIHQMLTSLMPEGLARFLECVVIGVCIILMYAVLAITLIYMERKICAFFQCRLGPMRVGKWGLLQVPCDVIKMLTKEIIDLKFSDICLPAHQQGIGGIGLQCRSVLPAGCIEYRRSGYPAGRLEFQQ